MAKILPINISKHPDYIKIDNQLRGLIFTLGDSMKRVYQGTLTKKEREGLNYTVKQEGKNKGQYGYYHNMQVYELYKLLIKRDITSLVDLGSGPGILLKILKKLDIDFKITKLKGFEIEESMVENGNRLFFYDRYIEQKDILTITKEDIAEYKALYFWEPLYDPKLAEKFVNNLVTCMNKDHTIIYLQAGSIKNYLDKACSNKILEPIWDEKQFKGRYSTKTNYHSNYLLYRLKQ